MKNDITRDTFDPLKHFSRVLMQQGRVQLDADWNEQTSILLRYLQALAATLIGPHGGSEAHAFEILARKDKGKDVARDFAIGSGHYYVNGKLCENGSPLLPYTGQLDYPLPDSSQLANNGEYLVYLDVWERHITCNEDRDICEVALGGPDTATRAQVVSQVKVLPLDSTNSKELEAAVKKLKEAIKNNAPKDAAALRQEIERLFGGIQQNLATNRTLRARARVAEKSDDPCTLSPESQYRGAENQLYRVEIHKGGVGWDGTLDKDGKPAGNAKDAATFKWSRDNGSVLFPILTLADDAVKLASLGRDKRQGLKIGDWVEIVDDQDALHGQAGPLLQAKEPDDLSVTFNASAGRTYKETGSTHPLLRRWDHRSADGALPVREGAGENDKDWIALEDGVQIQFTPSGTGGIYRAGDYWLIPARVATGDVLWPKVVVGEKRVAKGLPPHGVEHNYAPLAVIDLGGDGAINAPVTDLRRIFTALGQ